MALSMQDIATAAGVSLSTVSRALAGSPRVAPGTRTRIRRLANELGYVPSAIAHALATSRSYSLGMVVMDITDPFISELVRAVDRVALDHGYSLILTHCGADPERELAAIHRLRQQRVDAIVICDPSVAESSVPLLELAGVPVILVNRPSFRHAACTDNVQGARQAAEHLLDLGHTRIGYVAWQRHEEQNRDRQAGLEQALAGRGLGLDPALVVDGDGWPEGGCRSAQHLMALTQPPTALFCFNDLSAIGVMEAAQAAGWRVPHDLSVVGFDDIRLARYAHPPLTTVAQPCNALAHRTVHLALDLIAGDEPPPGAPLPARLVVRSSTDHPRPDGHTGPLGSDGGGSR
jgi:LacI family repressor for deo operon, udp, cdd, tsx, nupC, and nupG